MRVISSSSASNSLLSRRKRRICAASGSVALHLGDFLARPARALRAWRSDPGTRYRRGSALGPVADGAESIATIAATNGRRSPNATASPINGLNFSLFSMNCGANGVPSASLPTSFARSMMTRWPRGSIKPASPVLKPAVGGHRRAGRLVLLVVAAEHRSRADQHLAVLGDTDFGAGDRAGRPCRDRPRRRAAARQARSARSRRRPA